MCFVLFDFALLLISLGCLELHEGWGEGENKRKGKYFRLDDGAFSRSLHFDGVWLGNEAS
jgi:hypothetical protein